VFLSTARARGTSQWRPTNRLIYARIVRPESKAIIPQIYKWEIESPYPPAPTPMLPVTDYSSTLSSRSVMVGRKTMAIDVLVCT